MTALGSSAPKMAVPATMTLLPKTRTNKLQISTKRPMMNCFYQLLRRPQWFWDQPRRQLQYLYLGIESVALLPWGRIVLWIFGRLVLRAYKGMLKLLHIKSFTWIYRHNQQHVSSISNLVSDCWGWCIRWNGDTGFHVSLMNVFNDRKRFVWKRRAESGHDKPFHRSLPVASRWKQYMAPPASAISSTH